VSIYIAPEYQRRGLGKFLLRSFIECCSSLGVHTLLGFVFRHNTASVRLFERIGFERWGLLPGVAELDSIPRDLLILGKALPGKTGLTIWPKERRVLVLSAIDLSRRNRGRMSEIKYTPGDEPTLGNVIRRQWKIQADFTAKKRLECCDFRKGTVSQFRGSPRVQKDLFRQLIPRYNRALLECRLRSCVGNPPLISIIDDDESVREALCGLVRSVGFAARTFASAEEFVKSDQLGNADCLILDVCMPGMSGIELRRQLVADHCDVPVIFITAHVDKGMRAQALKSGAEAVLIKPFSEEALLNAIHVALSPQ